MSDIYITNSLTRKKEKFEPIEPKKVGVYTCGPTVYDRAQIGNLRTYTTSDLLVRILKANGFEVTHVMNLTDVGHLTGDNLGDADLGEDRMEKEARQEGKNAWEIADVNIGEFKEDIKVLNLIMPDILPRATDHIKEQIDLVKSLEEKGFTYKTSDGIYFDTSEFEKKTGKIYGEVSTLDKIKEGARVEKNPEKKNKRDFALWKFSPSASSGQAKRQMEWESPWGLGFPGWHIECSAMSMKYLGNHFDVHVGGEDLRQTHHPNEIAQSEAATGEKFVNYWVHATFLRVDGERMGKSKGNAYTLGDVIEKGFEPLALRYLYLTANYKDTLNFTWDSLESSQKALNKLREQVYAAKTQKQRTILSEEKRKKIDDLNRRFMLNINDDINIPKALALLWEALKSNIPSEDKYDLALNFDEVLGLQLAQYQPEKVSIPDEVKKLLEEREKLRSEGKFEEGDRIRKQINEKGFSLKDTQKGTKVVNKD